MSGILYTYDSQEVAVVFAASPIKGFVESELIRITPNSEGFTLAMGVDGDGTRSKTGNRSGRMAVMLQQSSASNDILSNIHQLDLDGPNGAGVGTLTMTDLSGRAKLVALEAWIVGWPEQGMAQSAGPREWVFEWVDAKILVAGN